MNLSGADSVDPDGTIVSYAWDFGNGQTGSGVTTQAVYDAAGTYVATLTVTLGDADGDGLPDAWEMANGTNPNVPDASADPDGDGHSNWQEYLAGTSPTNAASVLRLTAEFTSDGEPLLSFPAVSNHAYSLLGAAALGQDWLPLTNISAVPTNRLLWITNAPADTRFFRLLTPPASPLP